MTRLSICIPTYNFGKFIGETLDSILPQLCPGVEVVILDGGSTDNTAAVVREKAAGLEQVQYHRQEQRGGIDRDIARAVELAGGEYCWLFSADDIMKPGAIATVLTAIDSGADIYLCQHTLCTFDLQPIEDYAIFTTISTPTIFDLGKAQDRKKYFTAARTSEAFFSFLSGPIFRKELWDRGGGIPDSFYETCWALAGRLLSQVREGVVVQYLGKTLLFKRGDNDSFLERGVVNRLRISVDGFGHIAETIFGRGSEEAWHIRRVVRNERALLLLLLLKVQAKASPETESMADLNALVSRLYLDAGLANAVKYLLFRISPVPLLRVAAFLRIKLLALFS